MKKMSDRLYKQTAIDAALAAGKLIKSSVGKVKKITYKGRINIVTDVDKRSEAMIIKKILSVFPDHSILAEEIGAQDRCCGYKWIIDPLDGTTNFAHSFPFFCVSIGLEKDGDIILGVVYDPARDELFFAQRGRGAYLNNKRIHVSKSARLKDCLLATGFAYDVKEVKNDNIAHFKHFLMEARAIRRAGSAAIDLCYVACGRFDGFWELELCPWDMAAGTLIVKEAGGKITLFDGSEYDHYDKQVLASNGLIHNKMISVLCKSSCRGIK